MNFAVFEVSWIGRNYSCLNIYDFLVVFGKCWGIKISKNMEYLFYCIIINWKLRRRISF